MIGNSLFALGMEVDAFYFTLLLVEADVVETLEAGAVDRLHPVIGHQEMLLPAHENVFALRHVAHGNAYVAG